MDNDERPLLCFFLYAKAYKISLPETVHFSPDRGEKSLIFGTENVYDFL